MIENSAPNPTISPIVTNPTPPTQPPVSATNATPPIGSLPKECETCLRGGFPLRKELLSFAVVLLVAAVTLLFVLLVNEKRRNLTAQTATVPATSESTNIKTWALPQPKTIVSTVDLPTPKLNTTASLEAMIQSRRSRRTFAETPVSLANLSQILWSAQGITDPKTGYRTAPSGMSAFPFTVYVVVRNVTGVQPGLYQYLPEKNQLGYLGIANAGELLSAAGVQDGAQKAPVAILLSAAPAKTQAKLRNPGDPMIDVLLEAGHIGQNMYLEVEALKMSMVVMAGFDAAKVGGALQLDPNEEVVYLIPVGNRAPIVSPTPAATSSSVPATP